MDPKNSIDSKEIKDMQASQAAWYVFGSILFVISIIIFFFIAPQEVTTGEWPLKEIVTVPNVQIEFISFFFFNSSLACFIIGAIKSITTLDRCKK